MHRSISASSPSTADIVVPVVSKAKAKPSDVQIPSVFASKLGNLDGVLHHKDERKHSRTPGQSGFEPCFTEDEETAFEGSDDGATLYDEDFEHSGDGFVWNWDTCSFPSLLAERLDIPDDEDADLDFYSSLFDEHLDLPVDDSFEFEDDDEFITCDLSTFPSLLDEQLDNFESDSEPDLDFYPSLLSNQLDLPVDDSFEWPVSKSKTVRWADSQGEPLACVVLLTEMPFQDQDESDMNKYPSLLVEELDIPQDDEDFDWMTPAARELKMFKVQLERSNGEWWNPATTPSLFDEAPIHDLDQGDDDFELPVTDDIPSLLDEQMDLPEQDWLEDFVGRMSDLNTVLGEVSDLGSARPLMAIQVIPSRRV